VRVLLETLGRHPEVGLASADVGDGETPIIDAYFGSIAKPAEHTTGLESAAYPHGTLFAGRRSCLRDIGLFDERYFAYCEEADLGLRAAAGGWGVGIVRDAQVRNPSMGPGPGPAVVDYLMHRNTLLLVREHSGRYHASIRFVIALIDLVKGLYRPSSRQLLYSARGRAWALVDFLRGRHGPPPAHLFPSGE
jgi:GT2 family glycosyltransferase